MRALSVETARWLTTGEAWQALARLAEEALDERNHLALLTELRARYAEEKAAALLDQVLLRERAAEKFGALASRMLFTEEALQQATSLPIARYRAGRYARFGYVADLGCGIGGDAIALAGQVSRLHAVEQDPVRHVFAEHNLQTARGGAVVEVFLADWTAQRPPPTVEAAFIDPGRRVDGRRVFSLYEIQPPLPAILDLGRHLPSLGVKVMPGVADEELPDGCEVEFISEAGTLKEAVLWFGALRQGAARTATLITAGESTSLASDAPEAPAPVTPPRSYLWEPDPAVIRASLVTHLAYRLDATRIDEQIAYLTGDRPQQSAFARLWPVLDHLPFNLREVNRRLRALNAEVFAVKKRGSPIEPERFRRRLKSAPGGLPVTLFISRHENQPWMILCGEEIR